MRIASLRATWSVEVSVGWRRRWWGIRSDYDGWMNGMEYTTGSLRARTHPRPAYPFISGRTLHERRGSPSCPPLRMLLLHHHDGHFAFLSRPRCLPDYVRQHLRPGKCNPNFVDVRTDARRRRRRCGGERAARRDQISTQRGRRGLCEHSGTRRVRTRFSFSRSPAANQHLERARKQHFFLSPPRVHGVNEGGGGVRTQRVTPAAAQSAIGGREQ